MVENVIIKPCFHKDRALFVGCKVRITFFDFSSAFNTESLKLIKKLQMILADSPTVYWVTDYLTYRPQFVRRGAARSDVVVSDAGAPQGTELSALLFTLYISVFQ